jgi:hypothetical protein
MGISSKKMLQHISVDEPMAHIRVYEQLDLIKWSWIRCDKISELGVYSWAVKQSNSGTVMEVESDLVTTVIQ